MQINHPVIIPIPHLNHAVSSLVEAQSLSPPQSLDRSLSLREEIAWKKSVSAFKKFKGKKDKEAKSAKKLHTSKPFLQAQQQDPSTIKNFTLVDDINFSLLNRPDYELMKFEDSLNYFDPNTAPFFENSSTFIYSQNQTKPYLMEEQLECIKLYKKASSGARVKKQLYKKEKIKQQHPLKESTLKIQKTYSSQDNADNQVKTCQDPFIIIKASEKRSKQGSEQSIKLKGEGNQQSSKKGKLIKKRSRNPSRSSSVFSRELREVYIQQKSEDWNRSENYSSDEKSMGYGDDQLPMIQFDFGKPIHCIDYQEYQNGIDNLPIFQSKESAQLMSSIKPYQKSTEILQQYEFNHQFVIEPNILPPQQFDQVKNQEGLEKA